MEKPQFQEVVDNVIMNNRKNGKEEIVLPFKDNFAKTIEIDCPWQYKDRGFNGYETVPSHRIHCKYDTMSTEDILKMSGEIRRISNEECRLWFWTTKDFLEESFQIIREFGFEFRQILTWVKTNKKGQPSYGMGYYFRNTTEFLLYATNKKGLRPLQATTASNVLFAPREGHSRKPDVFYQFIKDNSEEPRVSLFQRTKRDGFHVWGNEINDGLES